MTATTDDLREFELEFDAEQPAAAAAPAVPAYLTSAARRRAADAEQGTGFFTAMYALITVGLVISMVTFGLVTYEHAEANQPAPTSVTAEQ
jgi:hypothetical protein